MGGESSITRLLRCATGHEHLARGEGWEWYGTTSQCWKEVVARMEYAEKMPRRLDDNRYRT